MGSWQPALKAGRGPKDCSAFKPAGTCLTGEMNLFLTTMVERNKSTLETHNTERTIAFPSQAPWHRVCGWGQANDSYTGLMLLGELWALVSRRFSQSLRSSPCPGYALLRFQTFPASSSIFGTASVKLWSCFTAHTWTIAGYGCISPLAL